MNLCVCSGNLPLNTIIYHFLRVRSYHVFTDRAEENGEDAFQVVDVSDGKIRTKQMNQRQKLKEAKNVDEFGSGWERKHLFSIG